MAHVNSIQPKLFTLDFGKRLKELITFFRALNFDESKFIVVELDKEPTNTNGDLYVPLFELRDKEFPKFYFAVAIQMLKGKDPHFLTRYMPSEETKNNQAVGRTKESKQVIEWFNFWLNLMNSYELLSQEIFNPFDESLFAPLFFDIDVNEELDSETLDEKQQEEKKVILNLIGAIVHQSNLDESEKIETLNLIQVSCESLATFTKKSYNEAMKLLVAKIKKWGFKMWNDMVETAKKEQYKKLINYIGVSIGKAISEGS